MLLLTLSLAIFLFATQQVIINFLTSLLQRSLKSYLITKPAASIQRNQRYIRQVMRWFVLSPFAVVFACHLLVDMRPTALHKLHKQQYDVECSIDRIYKHIQELRYKDPVSQSTQAEIDTLEIQLKKEHERLSHFKNNQDASTKMLVIAGGGSIIADAYFPFVALMWLILLLLGTAATHLTIPLYLRAASLSSGTALAVITLAQWSIAATYAFTWYARVGAIIFTLAIPIGIIAAWRRSIPNFISLFIKNS